MPVLALVVLVVPIGGPWDSRAAFSQPIGLPLSLTMRAVHNFRSMSPDTSGDRAAFIVTIA